jgi:hypothetical protein
MRSQFTVDSLIVLTTQETQIMLVKDIFAEDITRNIAPVVYFHDQSPDQVAQEVSEYIITGGYAETDPSHQRVKNGIHEQFVKLLTSMASELSRAGGADLPAAWISGFYGSGKSSFAKLLGLALDGMVLPDGRSLSEALLARDDSARKQEFCDAWEQVRSQVNPLAVVFDIGAIARDDEHIHSAVKRELQARLDYCTISHYVADFELKLELDGEWDTFLQVAEETLGKPWNEAKHGQLAEDEFSAVMHAMKPNLYDDPMMWIDSRAGTETGIGTSVAETTKAIANMLKLRAPGKTLFVVVDEVSQYIHQNTNRMLKLQSFVSDLGQKLKGQVWLLATGQQALEDSDDESNIGKLKDRFPPKLRVHLAPTNIRDVVHKRLLKKNPTKEAELRSLFQQHRSDLKLYAYNCDSITIEDFLEVYPMLPGYVDLLMQITTNLRTQSTRAKGDDYAIRGLLQLLGELFREQKLGDEDLGALVTMEHIFEVQQSALDPDVQNTLARIFGHEEVIGDGMAQRVAKAIALLELIQEQEPTTPTLICQCLYDRLGAGNQLTNVEKALEKLRGFGLLSYSEKTGYKIQSSAGQEWAKERDTYTVSNDTISEIVSEKLKELLGGVDRPRYKSNTFRWSALYSDGRQRSDERLQVPNDLAVVTVDFRFLTNRDDRDSATWIQASSGENLKNRLIWVIGSLGDLDSQIRELARSRNMVSRYGQRVSNLSREKQRQLFDEQGRTDELETKVKEAVARAFVEGELYFQGRQIDKQEHGVGFASLLFSVGESIIGDLYHSYVDIPVTPTELKQLLEPSLSGPSPKFMKGQLGILDLDAGKYAPTCDGEVPTRIAKYVTDANGITGNILLSHFGGPPYGYAPDMVKACLAGMLRAEKIRIRPEQGAVITSVRDPGAQDMFTKERDIRRAEILPPGKSDISARDRVKICNFFKACLQVELDRENDAIADAVFQQFPGLNTRLQDLERCYNKLPNYPDLPDALVKLRKALEKSTRSRQVQDTVLAVKKSLDDLRDGIQMLSIMEAELTDSAVEAVKRAVNVQTHQVKQLREAGNTTDVEEAIAALDAQLTLDRPWREIADLEPHLTAIEAHYQALRTELIDQQEKRADDIRQTVRQRQGFSELTTQQEDHVLRPVREAVAKYSTSPDALYPSLLELRDTAMIVLNKASDEANSNFDNTLSDLTQEQIIPVPLDLRGREVSNPEEVEELVSELRQKLLAQFQDRNNIRIRLI